MRDERLLPATKRVGGVLSRFGEGGRPIDCRELTGGVGRTREAVGRVDGAVDGTETLAMDGMGGTICLTGTIFVFIGIRLIRGSDCLVGGTEMDSELAVGICGADAEG